MNKNLMGWFLAAARTLGLLAFAFAAQAQAANEATSPVTSDASANTANVSTTRTTKSDSHATSQCSHTTRLRYFLRAYSRGEITGSGELLWVCQENRYRLTLEVALDLGTLRNTSQSQGRIDQSGLIPERFEEVSRFIPLDASAAIVF